MYVTEPLKARFMGPTWGPSGADRTQVGPMLAHEICSLGFCQLEIIELFSFKKNIRKCGVEDILQASQTEHYSTDTVGTEYIITKNRII